MKRVKVRTTGFETVVSDEYFEKYKEEGFFTEIITPVEAEKPKSTPARKPKTTKG